MEEEIHLKAQLWSVKIDREGYAKVCFAIDASQLSEVTELSNFLQQLVEIVIKKSTS